jgi:hypothetical protein
LISLASIFSSLSSNILRCITEGPSAVSLNNASLHSFANLNAVNL